MRALTRAALTRFCAGTGAAAASVAKRLTRARAAPPKSSTNAVANSLYNIIRVLKPQGVFLLISHWGPEKWLGYLEKDEYHWAITVQAVPRPVFGVPQDVDEDVVNDSYEDPSAVFFLYVCQKQGPRQ